jgi:enoyl-CoA hydratase/carnithine racemase
MTGESDTREPTRYERRGGAAWIRLCRPDKRNALDPGMLGGIEGGLERALGEEARVVVLTGTGSAFCAGADLAFVLAHLDDPPTVEALLERAGRLTLAIEECPVPVVAAVNGTAVAGGLELVLACDLVLAARDATFADGHARFGLFPGAGSSVRLPRLIGANRARELLYTGRTASAGEMHTLGVVNRVVPEGDLEAATDDLCRQLADGSASGLARMKRVVRGAQGMSVAEGLALELQQACEHLRSPDVRAGLRAFADKQGRAR